MSPTVLVRGLSLMWPSKLVFSSQCFHWSRLTEPSSPSPFPESSTHSNSTSSSVEKDLQTILEDAEDSDELREVDIKSEASSELSDAPTIMPDSGTPDSEDEVKPHPTSPFLHLPIQQLALPSPETYSQLHNLLHFTHSPPPSTFSPLPALLGSDIAALHHLENKELMKKLAVIQGVWKNCCYLGIEDTRIWNGMGDAWGAVIGIVAERSKRSQGSSMDLTH